MKEGSVADFLKGTESTIATGTIVGTDNGENYPATRVEFTSTKLTPHLTELVTTMYARRRSTAYIASECQGSIETLHRARMGPSRRPKGPKGHITASYSDRTLREKTKER